MPFANPNGCVGHRQLLHHPQWSLDANQRHCRTECAGDALISRLSERSSTPSNKAIHNARRRFAATRASNISASRPSNGLFFLCWSGIGSLHLHSFSERNWFGIGCRQNGPLQEINLPSFLSAQGSRCCLPSSVFASCPLSASIRR